MSFVIQANLMRDRRNCITFGLFSLRFLINKKKVFREEAYQHWRPTAEAGKKIKEVRWQVVVKDHVNLVQRQVTLEATAGIPHYLAHGVLEQGHTTERLNLAPSQRIMESGCAIVDHNVVGSDPSTENDKMDQ